MRNRPRATSPLVPRVTRCDMHDGAVIDVYGTVTVVLVATHV